MQNLQVWLLTLGAAASFVMCDGLAAYWGKSKSLGTFVFFVLAAPLSYILFGLINEHKTLVVSAGIVNMCVLIGTTLVGIFVFQEALSSRQIVGLGFALIAIFLIR
jgi:multidrug transporter EmrE-like cation transporter